MTLLSRSLRIGLCKRSNLSVAYFPGRASRQAVDSPTTHLHCWFVNHRASSIAPAVPEHGPILALPAPSIKMFDE